MTRPRAIRPKSALAVRQRVLCKAADLHIITERIIQMQAVEPAVTYVLDSHRDQFGLGPLAVEVGNRVADMVDNRFGFRPPCGTGILRTIERAGDDERQGYVLGRHIIGLFAYRAERQRDFGLLEPDLFQVKDLRVPIAGLPEIRA